MSGQLVCLGCPVRKECTEYRERTKSEYGIWGGENTKRGEK